MPQPTPTKDQLPIPTGLFAGAGYLRRGFGLWLTSPRLMLLGAIPALIVGAVYVVGIIVLALNVDKLAAWLTPFANSWDEPLQVALRFAVSAALVIASVLLIAYTFAAVTLAVGDPFYERIWRSVENTLGNPPAELKVGVWRSIGRAIADGIRLVVPAIGIGLLVFACGFVPFVGPVLAGVLGAVFGGWILAVELTGFAFDARGYGVSERRSILGRRRATTLGFGILTYLLFLVPVAAVVVMPAAVAGAAMLSRDALAGAAAPTRHPHP